MARLSDDIPIDALQSPAAIPRAAQDGPGFPAVGGPGGNYREHTNARRELFLVFQSQLQRHCGAGDDRSQSGLYRQRDLGQAGRIGQYGMDRYSLGTGWLESRPELDGNLCGVSVPRWSVREKAPFPTRRQEYTFCRDALQRLQTANAGN